MTQTKKHCMKMAINVGKLKCTYCANFFEYWNF